MRRTLIAFGVLGFAILFAHVSFRASVAYALAYSPNGGGIGASGPFRADTPPRALEIRVDVGPPNARIAGWVLVPPEEQEVRGTIVLLHGIRMDRRALLGFAQEFADRGYRSVLLDLRGHGESTGTHLTYGTVEARDVSQVLDTVETRYGRTPTFLFGHSYGGAVALHVAASDARVLGVVSVSAFASVRSVVNDYERRYVPELEPWIPESWLSAAVNDAAELAEFDPEQSPESAAARIRVPLLLIHGTRDTQVPPSHARALAFAARAPTELVLLPGDTHDSVISGSRSVVAHRALEHFDAVLNQH